MTEVGGLGTGRWYISPSSATGAVGVLLRPVPWFVRREKIANEFLLWRKDLRVPLTVFGI